MLAISACKSNKPQTMDFEDSRFVMIETTALYNVCYDKETNVMYTLSKGYYTNGVFTVMVDANGKPLKYNPQAKY